MTTRYMPLDIEHHLVRRHKCTLPMVIAFMLGVIVGVVSLMLMR